MPVSTTEKASTDLARLSAVVVGAPAVLGRLDAQRDRALLGELEGVGEQVLEDLLQALGVGVDGRAAVRRSSSIAKSQALGVGDVAEGALDVVVQIAEAQLADLDRRPCPTRSSTDRGCR